MGMSFSFDSLKKSYTITEEFFCENCNCIKSWRTGKCVQSLFYLCIHPLLIAFATVHRQLANQQFFPPIPRLELHTHVASGQSFELEYNWLSTPKSENVEIISGSTNIYLERSKGPWHFLMSYFHFPITGKLGLQSAPLVVLYYTPCILQWWFAVQLCVLLGLGL